ncbi:Zinc finger BED domain-containing protein RICESLEEPER 2 [Glycine max]|nr:Zinc finger BED domain-containing protein RICESLEEPER 2 [Glycine max]
MWAFQYGNPDFQKVSRKTVRSDCLAIYNAEKNRLKALLKTVNKISLTTDMWKSCHQVVEYMVVTGHFIDCLKAWGIKENVFYVSVDNASYIDSYLKNLKENLSLSTKLVLNGDLFHVRCCAHILNLLVQDGLGKIKDIIQNVRESVKYINHNDARLKAFSDVVEEKHLKERKLILDSPTRWNSTFQMLSTALKFKISFSTCGE